MHRKPVHHVSNARHSPTPGIPWTVQNHHTARHGREAEMAEGPTPLHLPRRI